MGSLSQIFPAYERLFARQPPWNKSPYLQSLQGKSDMDFPRKSIKSLLSE
ncbi:hypothetical protein CSC43_7041 [Pseudomonas aeruginosa]|nr:hypothetical protein CSC43_7041 [Pseudomonas aeruginosa]